MLFYCTNLDVTDLSVTENGPNYKTHCGKMQLFVICKCGMAGVYHTFGICVVCVMHGVY